MDKEIKKWLAIVSIAIAVTLILILLLSGFDLAGIKIHKGFKINLS